MTRGELARVGLCLALGALLAPLVWLWRAILRSSPRRPHCRAAPCRPACPSTTTTPSRSTSSPAPPPELVAAVRERVRRVASDWPPELVEATVADIVRVRLKYEDPRRRERMD